MTKRLRYNSKVMISLVLLSLALTLVGAQFGGSASAQAQFGDPNFELTWKRTDLPVQQGVVARAWYWGPLGSNQHIMFETYVDAPDGTGQRLVQYFDKSRMEVNNPNGDRNSRFFVTNGLLSNELITGRLQLGDNTFEQRTPAQIDIASDVDDANAPTYASFGAVITIPAADRTGQKATQTINRVGTVGDDPSKGNIAGTQFVHYEPATQHNIPQAMWDFLNLVGPVYENGAYVQRRLNDPWFYASGYPIAEPFWASVKIAGVQRDVLIQPYQRRVLTYVPSNPAGYKVEVGNIGQHYYDWRYGNNPPPATNTPGAGATPTSTPNVVPTATPLPKPIAGKIVYTSNLSDTTNTQIYSIKANGSSRTNLTNNPSINQDPVWSPDGNRIAFISNRRDDGLFHLYVMNADGGSPVELNPTFPANQYKPAWSPDGNKIAFVGKDTDSYPGGEIFVTQAVAGVDPIRITENTAVDADPAWSPDSSKLVFDSDRDGTTSLYIMNADGGSVTRLTNPTSGQPDVLPRWSPQGHLIVFRGGPTDNADIYTVNVNGSNRKKIVNNTTNDWDPAFNSDGTRIVFMRQLGKQQLYTMKADGADVIVIPSQDAAHDNRQPDWFDK